MTSEMADSVLVTRAIRMVNETLVNEFELAPSAIVPEARLREDLGLDSLDAVDLIVALEKALHLRIPEEVAHGMRSIGDVYNYVRTVVGSSAARLPADGQAVDS
jgi:acyl carrier protein